MRIFYISEKNDQNTQEKNVGFFSTKINKSDYISKTKNRT